MEDKYNIDIKYIAEDIKEKLSERPELVFGIQVTAAMVIAGGLIIGTAVGTRNFVDKANNTKFIAEDSEYNINDIYVVYSVDDVHFCTRNIVNISEQSTTSGAFRVGNGQVNEYYYRDDIYAYYDVTTGEKVCQDHDNGFYVETLSSFYSLNERAKNDYEIGLDQASEKLSSDYLLSRESYETRRLK